MARWQLYVVSHTHWDREWYLPYEVFRFKLVELMDDLLALLDRDPAFKHFMLDGQTIVLEDYLAVRPERAGDIRRHVAGGRLLIGPWYVLPDEFLVSGEAIVRNLLRGRRVAARFGEAMPVGYLPDPFGHIAQMPQILRGFGIDSAAVWRGVGDEVRGSEFQWRSPDGSEVLTEYLHDGYDNALRLPLEQGPLLEMLQHVREVLEPRSQTGYLLLLNGGDHTPAQGDLPQVIAAANERLAEAELGHSTLPAYMRAVSRAVTERKIALDVWDGELRSSRFAHLLPGVLSARIWIKQRNTACQVLLERWAEPLSAYTKTLGAEENLRSFLDVAWGHLLQNHAHDSICGCSIDQVHEEMKLRFDSADQIAGAVVERSLHSIAERINTSALPAPMGYARSVSSALSSCLVVFNSEAGPRTDFVTATVQVPGGIEDVAVADDAGRLIPSQLLSERKVEAFSRTVSRGQLRGLLRLAGFGRDWTPERVRMLERTVAMMAGDKLPALVVEDVDIRPGEDADTVLVEARTASTGEHNYAALAIALREVSTLVGRGDVEYVQIRALRRDEVELGFVARDVPGHGFASFQLLPGHRQAMKTATVVSGDTIENEFFSVRASHVDGTLAVIDKQNGSAITGLNALEDGGDAGDEYNYSPPAGDAIVQGSRGPVEVHVLEEGPVRSRLRIAQNLSLPRSLSDDRKSRSQTFVDCPVEVQVSLYTGVPRIDVRLTVHNMALDHRLRVRFPTRVVADHAHVDTAFAVVERPVAVPVGGDAWIEKPTGAGPQNTFVDVSDGEVGLAVANRGLPEYEVLPGREGVIVALTLLRCVGWLSRDDLSTRRGAAGPSLETPGAQLQGVHSFEYSILPHAGDWEHVAGEARYFASPLRAVATALHPGPLAGRLSFVQVQPEGIVLSAFKQAEDGDGVIVRLYNPGAAHALARLEFAWPVAVAEVCGLDEEPQVGLQVNGHGLGTPIKAGQILTLRLRFVAASDTT